MDSISIELKGSEIASIDHQQDRLNIEFSRAYLIKTMTGSKEQTRWWQAGSLIMEGAEFVGSVPITPLICAGGDIEENIYTYRDMLPIPFESRGQVRCELSFVDEPNKLIATGSSIRLVMHETPKYIEHLRPEGTG